jgi:hypothetical protein
LTERNLIQGEIHEDPSKSEMDVELLLERFLKALLEEQQGVRA